jgi:hypothetical protein
MFETAEILLKRTARTFNNMRRANELAESVENHKAYIAALGESHRTELLNLKSAHAANLDQLKKESHESHSNERAA